MPLAIVTASVVDDFVIENSAFVNNTALTGSLFVMNGTGKIQSVNFTGNQAVQGAGLFVVNSDIFVERSVFSGNTALTLGGAASLASSNTSFENCDFLGNTGAEGGVISAKEMERLVISKSRVKRNNSTNGTFVNVDGDTELRLADVEVDDDFPKAVFLSHIGKVNFSNSKFNCRLRCQTLPLMPLKMEEKPAAVHKPQATATADEWEEENVPRSRSRVIVVIFPVVFVVTLLALVISRSALVRKFFRRLTLKGRHAL
jgi:hypothetical protein